MIPILWDANLIPFGFCQTLLLEVMDYQNLTKVIGYFLDGIADACSTFGKIGSFPRFGRSQGFRPSPTEYQWPHSICLNWQEGRPRSHSPRRRKGLQGQIVLCRRIRSCSSHEGCIVRRAGSSCRQDIRRRPWRPRYHLPGTVNANDANIAYPSPGTALAHVSHQS